MGELQAGPVRAEAGRNGGYVSGEGGWPPFYRGGYWDWFKVYYIIHYYSIDIVHPKSFM